MSRRPSSSGSNKKRHSSFLSNPLNSLKRAVSSKGRKSDKESEANAAPSNPFLDPPPAYAAESPSLPEQQARSRTLSLYSRLRGGGVEDKFRFLAEFDTAFLIDDSGSMAWGDGLMSSRPDENRVSRWEQTRNVIKQIVPICLQYDQDGVDLYFLNDPYHFNINNPNAAEPTWSQSENPEEGKGSHVYVGIRDAKTVNTVFNNRQPFCGTPTGKRLGGILTTYVDCYETRMARGSKPPKPLNIIVITDGEANDKGALRDILIQQAARLDTLNAPYYQLGVQFFQVGRDKSATSHLHELDDGLGKYRAGTELRDMVDCVTPEQFAQESGYTDLTGDVILKVVLGAVNKHLDNQRIREGKLVRPA
ncbi:putative von willebrand factor [Rosellinia necatrix]|uniref:Putative von willebrand factor n=1 Tax=Rosellinia necatrix TaxID=77044 RepID=A0A1W2TC69_ROSNE|nr:putative von willebrand factor [Rosellinia necatrix]